MTAVAVTAAAAAAAVLIAVLMEINDYRIILSCSSVSITILIMIYDIIHQKL
jgi:hypothetical protein